MVGLLYSESPKQINGVNFMEGNEYLNVGKIKFIL